MRRRNVCLLSWRAKPTTLNMDLSCFYGGIILEVQDERYSLISFVLQSYYVALESIEVISKAHMLCAIWPICLVYFYNATPTFHIAPAVCMIHTAGAMPNVYAHLK